MIDTILLEQFPQDDAKWMIVEYGAINWNTKIPDEPLVDVLLKNLKTNKFAVCTVAKSFSTYAPLGSIWVNGVCGSDRRDLTTEYFDFDMTSDDLKSFGAWQTEDSTNHDQISPRRYVIPPHRYKIPRIFNQCRYLQFETRKGVQLVVNALTVFDGMYGHSGRVRQVVMNNNAQQALDLLEFKGFELDDYSDAPEPDDYILGLKKDVYDRDAYFVHQLKENRDTQLAVNAISAQLNNSRSRPCYLNVRPWFNGEHKWQVSGIWLVPNKRFLALRIERFKYPRLPNFFIVRENHNLTGDDNRDAKPRKSGRKTNTNNNPRGSNSSGPTPNTLREDLHTNTGMNWGETPIRKPTPKENKTKSKSLPPKPVHHPDASTSNMNDSNSNAVGLNINHGKSTDSENTPEPSPATNAVTLLFGALQVIIKKQNINTMLTCLEPSGQWMGTVPGDAPGLYELAGIGSWDINRNVIRELISGIKVFQPRRLGIYQLKFNNKNFFFIGIERFNSERFRSAIYHAASSEDFIGRLPSIIASLEEYKGVWKRFDDAIEPNVGIITHKGDESKIAEQILRKIRAFEGQ